ncbi:MULTISPECIES: DUF5133 domain-containing protein [Streptomyces]|uniref:DUF5133 domain-containing protein n=1 Tax=Streptomyces sp. SYP-A7185 TaxID=3040076 RepID=UPI0038F635DA
MLMAHPSVLRKLMSQYEEMRALHEQGRSAEARQGMEDLAYTLCVCTGTREVQAALTAARQRLTEAPEPAGATERHRREPVS